MKMCKQEKEVRKKKQKSEISRWSVRCDVRTEECKPCGWKTDSCEKERKRDEKLQEVIRRKEPTSTPPRSCTQCGNQNLYYCIVVYSTRMQVRKLSSSRWGLSHHFSIQVNMFTQSLAGFSLSCLSFQEFVSHISQHANASVKMELK